MLAFAVVVFILSQYAVDIQGGAKVGIQYIQLFTVYTVYLLLHPPVYIYIYIKVVQKNFFFKTFAPTAENRSMWFEINMCKTILKNVHI